ncbi:MAG: FxsA family protein [Rhodobacteraceae bacterium]|nr:FxsA family protein [Paracoccaceae bacterium]
MWLLLIFILVPIIEVGLFIQVGGWIGLWPTLALVIVMAFLGSWLLRQQGLRAFADLQSALQEMRDPTGTIAHGALILFAGLLMITPGFFTDIIGLLLLIPPVRHLVLRHLATRLVVLNGTRQHANPSRAARAADDIVEADYVEISPRDSLKGPSGWTRH